MLTIAGEALSGQQGDSSQISTSNLTKVGHSSPVARPCDYWVDRGRGESISLSKFFSQQLASSYDDDITVLHTILIFLSIESSLYARPNLGGEPCAES